MTDELNEERLTADEQDERDEQGAGREPAEAAADEVEDRPAEAAAVLEITTEVAPAKLILINGEEYKLLNFDHLSPEQETAVTANFARFQKVYRRLSAAKNDADAQVEANKLRVYREKLIVGLTTVPREVVRGLGAGKQGQLLTAVQNEIGAEVETDEVGDADGDAD